MATVSPILEVIRVSKSFPGVAALSDVSLQLNRGEVLALIGENGAGKSTLMKILAGIQTPDAGAIRLEGQTQRIQSVQDANRLGIALIHQELNLCDNLDVASNIFLGREPRQFGFINHRKLRDDGQAILQSIGLATPPETIVKTLSIGQQQMVEIAKAISTNARVMIMDEPTSSLSQKETDRLFDMIDQLRKRGVSIIYISHRLSEIKLIADRVEVLRDGRNAGGLSREQITHEAMVQRMVGRDWSSFHPHQPLSPGAVALDVRGVRTFAFPHHEVNFQVRRREIVGLAGLVGAGRSELLTTLFGITRPLAGQIVVAGRPIAAENCRQAIDAGMALVPEDRKAQGVVVDMNVRENMSLCRLKQLTRSRLFIDHRRERQSVTELTDKLGVRTPSIEQFVKLLSGGNQQKIVIGKWLACAPKVLLMDEPTRGVDVGAKQEIYRLMDQMAAADAAILFVSSDMEEILATADRILVMHEGRLTGELARPQFSEEAVMNLATGLVANSAKS
jgi:ribose transport system ATP-binding protein